MTLHWATLAFSVVLLCVPTVLPAQFRKRLVPGRRSFHPTVLGMLLAWPNWLDAARAFLGTYLLMEKAIRLAPADDAGAMTALLLKSAILVAGVLIQVLRGGSKFALLSPGFYLCGMTLVLPGMATGTFAVFVGWLFAAAGKNPAYLLPAMCVAAAAGGYLLSGINLYLLLCVGLILLPLVMGQLFRKPLLSVAIDTSVASTPQKA
jgi:hypothetical protein